MKQVEKEHYKFSNYVTKIRWSSYWHQIDEAVNAKKILVVGVGDGIVPAVLKQIGEGGSVKTFDYDEALKPDYTGDLREIHKSVKDEKFDCILCSQVLEHLEYKDVDAILQYFSTHAEKVVISIPACYWNLFIINIKLPLIKKFVLSLKIPKIFKAFKFDGEHYWEMGAKGYSKRKIKRDMNKYFVILKEYHVPENPYHYFFILQVPKL